MQPDATGSADPDVNSTGNSSHKLNGCFYRLASFVVICLGSAALKTVMPDPAPIIRWLVPKHAATNVWSQDWIENATSNSLQELGADVQTGWGIELSSENKTFFRDCIRSSLTKRLADEFPQGPQQMEELGHAQAHAAFKKICREVVAGCGESIVALWMDSDTWTAQASAYIAKACLAMKKGDEPTCACISFEIKESFASPREFSASERPSSEQLGLATRRTLANIDLRCRR
jgi:hypothetical protein